MGLSDIGMGVSGYSRRGRARLIGRAILAGAVGGAFWGGFTAQVVYGSPILIPLGSFIMAVPGAVTAALLVAVITGLAKWFSGSTARGAVLAFVLTYAIEYLVIAGEIGGVHMLFKSWYAVVPLAGALSMVGAVSWALRPAVKEEEK